MAISSLGTIPAGSQISPVNERIYNQSNLIGDWKGNWTKNKQAVELDVINIKGGTAQVQYTHNGYTEKGTATVDGDTITYGNVTLGTRDGKQAALEFAYGGATQSAILAKAAAPADQNNLVGNWIGATALMSAAIQVLSIGRRDAQVKYSIGGQTGQGTGTAYKGAVEFGNVQLSSKDGLTGTAIYQVGHQTLSLAVKKFTPKTA